MTRHAPRLPIHELSRPLIVDRVPRAGSTEIIKADADECVALARRLNIPALHGLKANIRATPWRGGGLKLEGSIIADLEQVSVVSLEPFRQTLEITLQRYFLPSGRNESAVEDDADPIENGIVDIGEVVSETLALDLDPYPRKPGESFSAHIEDDGANDQVESPFAALAKRPPDEA